MVALDRKVPVVLCAGAGLLLALAAFPTIRAYAGETCYQTKNCLEHQGCTDDNDCLNDYEMCPADAICFVVPSGSAQCDLGSASGHCWHMDDGTCSADSGDVDCNGNTTETLCFGGTFDNFARELVFYDTYRESGGPCP